MPDRLPSLIVLVGFWVPPALAGWAAARSIRRPASRPRTTYNARTAFILAYAVAWFLFNLGAIPPYIPGATMDPKFVPEGAVGWLALLSGGLILPGSALACAAAFRLARGNRITESRGDHGEGHGDRRGLFQEHG